MNHPDRGVGIAGEVVDHDARTDERKHPLERVRHGEPPDRVVRQAPGRGDVERLEWAEPGQRHREAAPEGRCGVGGIQLFAPVRQVEVEGGVGEDR